MKNISDFCNIQCARVYLTNGGYQQRSYDVDGGIGKSISLAGYDEYNGLLLLIMGLLNNKRGFELHAMRANAHLFSTHTVIKLKLYL